MNFFRGFSQFKCRDKENLTNAFHRMVQESKWPEKDKESNCEKFKDAMIHEAKNLGDNQDRTSLDIIHAVALYYEICQFDGLPKNITDGNKLFDNVFINIVDLVAGKKHRFDTHIELVRYTKKNKLYFPRREAKDKKFEFLLVPMFKARR